MRNIRISPWIVAMLGVVAGALSVVTWNKCTENNKRVKAEYGHWRKLNLIMESVSNNYVDSVNFAEVTDAAVVAALSKLDPHTVYLPPVQLEESESELSGNFEGIGIQFNVPNDTAIVLEVIPGGPAEKIGMKQGDRLLKVDDKVIAGVKFPQDSMVRRMKGPSGTKVTVTVGRGNEIIPFEITRGKIPVHSIDASFMLDAHTGYIRLSKFSRSTAKEFADAAQELMDSGMRELIFDLRDNTGGYFDQAYILANFFLEKGDMVVYMQGRHRPKEEFKSDGSGFLKNIALKVLINEGSASSSEIFAGAIQDNDRGVIIGRRSFGKGLVQEPVYFTDGSGVRITVARFYTPSGRCIQKPYGEDYHYDIYKRYTDGEMTDADSIKVNKDMEFTTVGGRKVYGGGGIIPDVFVPVDTSSVPRLYIDLNRKATPARFASQFFDSHKSALSEISDYDKLLDYFEEVNLEKEFLRYAAVTDNIRPASDNDWQLCEVYMMPLVRALVGRYSKLGDNAFYHLYLDVDNVVKEARKPHFVEINN